ncbi:MAG: phosphate acyltransferase PlsX [Bacteroidetes bacterium]|nr:phosphate acyltransferase PlsX [Bacteroidota bacterium]
MLSIGLDIMGGDFAPQEAILGAIQAQVEFGKKLHLVLIGDKDQALKIISEVGGNPFDFDYIHTTEVITFNDHPAKALSQKKDSSISVGFELLKEKKIDAFISAGNTGAMLVGSIFSVKPINGIIRPTISTVIPKLNGGYGLLLDVGANADCRPDVLYQFGLLGSLFCSLVYKMENPKVGLINIGEEKEKGNLVAQAAHQLMLDNTQYNFVGNIEGRDLFTDKADVAVCDGFTGNVVLKTCESFFHIMKKRGIKDDYLERFNYEDYGGTPILGVNAPVIIGHGISNAKAFKNMIKLAKEMVEVKLIDQIKATF